MVDRKTCWRFSLLVLGWIFDILTSSIHGKEKWWRSTLGTSNWMQVVGTSLQKSPLFGQRISKLISGRVFGATATYLLCCGSKWLTSKMNGWNSFQSFFSRFDRWRWPGGCGIVTVCISIGNWTESCYLIWFLCSFMLLILISVGPCLNTVRADDGG